MVALNYIKSREMKEIKIVIRDIKTKTEVQIKVITTDELIYENVLEKGTLENIIFISLNHSLRKLQKDPSLNTYRIDIMFDGKIYQVIGTLKKGIENTIDSFYKKLTLPVELNIKFQE